MNKENIKTLLKILDKLSTEVVDIGNELIEQRKRLDMHEVIIAEKVLKED
jgi:hypothetical protein